MGGGVNANQCLKLFSSCLENKMEVKEQSANHSFRENLSAGSTGRLLAEGLFLGCWQSRVAGVQKAVNGALL